MSRWAGATGLVLVLNAAGAERPSTGSRAIHGVLCLLCAGEQCRQVFSRSEMSEPSRQACCIPPSPYVSVQPACNNTPMYTLYGNSLQLSRAPRVRHYAESLLLREMMLDLPQATHHPTCAAYTNLRLGPACSSSCLRDVSDPAIAGTDWSRLLLMSAVSLDAAQVSVVATW